MAETQERPATATTIKARLARNSGAASRFPAPADKVAGKANGKEDREFTLDGKEVGGAQGETIWQVAKRHGIEIPHLCYSPEPGYRADGNCRACMVEIEGERVLAASCIRKPAEGMKVKAPPTAPRPRGRWCSSCWSPISPSARPRTIRNRSSGAGPTRWGSTSAAFPSARRCRRPTAAMSRWRSISTPASSAISASAPAAKCRSTTSSVWPAAATARRSCSISTIRWGSQLAWHAANACRPARPAR